jgi:hypothetical protein
LISSKLSSNDTDQQKSSESLINTSGSEGSIGDTNDEENGVSNKTILHADNDKISSLKEVETVGNDDIGSTKNVVEYGSLLSSCKPHLPSLNMSRLRKNNQTETTFYSEGANRKDPLVTQKRLRSMELRTQRTSRQPEITFRGDDLVTENGVPLREIVQRIPQIFREFTLAGMGFEDLSSPKTDRPLLGDLSESLNPTPEDKALLAISARANMQPNKNSSFNTQNSTSTNTSTLKPGSASKVLTNRAVYEEELINERRRARVHSVSYNGSKEKRLLPPYSPQGKQTASFVLFLTIYSFS